MKPTYKEEILARIKKLNIEHSQYREFHKMLDTLRDDRSPDNDEDTPNHLFILGESGVGKSTLLKKYANANPGYVHTDEKGTKYDIRPVVYTELPESFTVKSMYQYIVAAMGARQMGLSARIGDVRLQAFMLLKEQRVEMLILDEVNHILDSRIRNNEAMAAIKQISNIGNVCVVLAGTPETEQLLLNFQYARRFPTVHFTRFGQCDADFCKFLESVEEQIGLPFDIGLGDPTTMLPQVLYEMTKGIFGTLIPLLKSALKEWITYSEFSELNNRVKFIECLDRNRRPFVGDNAAGSTRMLERSESQRHLI